MRLEKIANTKTLDNDAIQALKNLKSLPSTSKHFSHRKKPILEINRNRSDDSDFFKETLNLPSIKKRQLLLKYFFSFCRFLNYFI